MVVKKFSPDQALAPVGGPPPWARLVPEDTLTCVEVPPMIRAFSEGELDGEQAFRLLNHLAEDGHNPPCPNEGERETVMESLRVFIFD